MRYRCRQIQHDGFRRVTKTRVGAALEADPQLGLTCGQLAGVELNLQLVVVDLNVAEILVCLVFAFRQADLQVLVRALRVAQVQAVAIQVVTRRHFKDDRDLLRAGVKNIRAKGLMNRQKGILAAAALDQPGKRAIAGELGVDAGA